MELAEPTIEQAVAQCVARGARRVVVAPYFLSRGRHIQVQGWVVVGASAPCGSGVPSAARAGLPVLGRRAMQPGYPSRCTSLPQCLQRLQGDVPVH